VKAWIGVLLLACLPLAAGAQQKIQSGGFSYSVDKVPSWVAPPPPATGAPAGRGSLRYLLADSQVRLEDAAPVRFLRLRMTPLDQSMLNEASDVRINFNPAYETLTLHEVGVTRAGRRADRLPGTKVQLLQREQELERSIYHGVVTAFILINDVRIDDVIDVSFSIRGANPIFEGKYSDSFALNSASPTDVRRVRIDYDSRRTLRHKVFGLDLQPTLTPGGQRSVLEMVVANQAPLLQDDLVPRWARTYPELQVTEYADWKEVAAWASQHYQTPKTLSPELRALADEIRKEAATPEQRAMRVLAFVQDNIRYFAVATGTSSHKPSPPHDTFTRRYGDCKDKTVLAVALLNHVGIQARPALVSLSRLEQVGDWLPTPLAFDHVITQARIGERTYWFDATRSHQGRSPDLLGFEPFGLALTVAPDSSALTQVAPPPDYRERYEVVERFTIAKYGSPAKLTVTTRMAGGQAERSRAYLASSSLDVYTADLENHRKRIYPGLKRVAPLEVIDNATENTLLTIERYEIADLFTYEKGRVSTSIYASALGSLLQPPSKVTRSSPLELRKPMTLSHRFELDLPLDPRGRSSAPTVLSSPHMEFVYRSLADGKRLTLEFELSYARDRVLPQEMAGYLDQVYKARSQLERRLSLPLFDGDQADIEYGRLMRGEQSRLARLPDWMRSHMARTFSSRVVAEQVVNSGQLAGRQLAEAWVDLAVERSNAGERNSALEDLKTALTIQPDLPRAFRVRGELLAYLGLFDEALAQFAQAKAGRDPDADYANAQALYFLGRFAEAADGFSEAARRAGGSAQMYRFIWLHLAAQRAGKNPRDVLRQAGYGSRGEWPGPIASYLLGDTPEARLLAIAREDTKEALPRACEAWFFIGQRRLIAGDVEGARAAFEQAKATQILPYVEYAFSDVELRRLRR
jgi:lipoprotein NlpI